MGEKGFLKSLKRPIKISRLAKVFSKHGVNMLHNISSSVYIIAIMVSLGFLV
jgi:hypothetical protein